jgi:integrase/recombinase XerD
MNTANYQEFTKNLKKIATDLPQLSYREPVLKDRNGDITKRWYVEFYLENEQGKLERKQEFIPSTIKSRGERYEYGNSLMDTIKEILKSGEIEAARLKKKEAEGPRIKLLDALTEIQDYIKKFLSHRSWQSYKHGCDSLSTWLINKRLHDIYCDEYSDILAARFLKEQFMSKNIKAKTYNNYMQYQKTIFSKFKEFRYIKSNPYEGMKSLPKTDPEIIIWSKQHRDILSKYLQAKKPDLYLAVLLVFQCFMRPQEIIRVRIKDLHLKNGVLLVPGKIGKNKRTKPVTLTDKLVELLLPIVRKAEPEWYLVGKNLKPSPEPIHRNTLTSHFSRARKACKLPEELKLYSFKHTGNSLMLENGVDLATLRDQNRHATTSQTDIYIKRLNLKASESIKNLAADL